MTQKITGEAPFQVLATNFSISPSQQNYVLQISADGTNYSDLFTVSAGQTKMVTNVANGSYYRLKNNNSEVTVNWRTQCNDGQGGGGGSYILPPATQQTLGGIKVGSGLTVQADGTLSANGGGSIDPTIVQQMIDANNEQLEEGNPIVGMARQLYSPDGVTSNGLFAYRTTAGDADVATGDAELRVLKGNSDYSEVSSEYDASASLERGGEEVTGFTYEITTGDVGSWQSVPASTADTFALQCVSARAKVTSVTGGGAGRVYFAIRQYNAPNNYTNVTFNYAETGYTEYTSKCTQVDSTHWTLNDTYTGAEGTVEFDGEWLVLTITNADTHRVYLYNCYVAGQWSSTVVEGEAQIGGVAENDLNIGETTYTYDGSVWSPSLPLAISNMEVDGSTYEPQAGDEISIYKEIIPEGFAKFPDPTMFVSVGLNSFDYTCEGILTTKSDETKVYYDANDNNGHWGGGTGNTGYTTYFVKAVTGLEDGYVLHSPNGKLQFRAGLAPANNFEDSVSGDNDLDFSGVLEVSANTTYVVYPTTAMPYAVFSVEDGDETDICVHPRWSGKMDNAFEEYSESVIDGLMEILENNPLRSIGNNRDELNLKEGVVTRVIGNDEFDMSVLASFINNGYTLGVDLAYDEEHIYFLNDRIWTGSVETQYAYKDNDFGVEYFANDDGIIDTPIYAETYYITNLVDKLRRMESYFIHLDSPNTEGETGKTYEYQGRIMQWVEGSGHTAEWLSNIANIDNTEGTGLIYSTIPDGQKLFEYKYSYGGEWRYVIYSGGTLYCTETGGTVVSSATIGQTFIFQTQSQSNYQVKGYFENGHIGFIKIGYVSFQNVWDGNAANSHYELIDKYNYPYTNVQSNGVEAGIAKWNKYGQVVKKQGDISTKAIQFNTNASQYSSTGKISFYTDGINNGPDRIFVPTEGGTSGQVLVSSGDNAAPVWATMIKVVKISSADYDALVQAGTTDPNTLYAIVDE